MTKKEIILVENLFRIKDDKVKRFDSRQGQRQKVCFNMVEKIFEWTQLERIIGKNIKT